MVSAFAVRKRELASIKSEKITTTLSPAPMLSKPLAIASAGASQKLLLYPLSALLNFNVLNTFYGEGSSPNIQSDWLAYHIVLNLLLWIIQGFNFPPRAVNQPYGIISGVNCAP